MGSYSRVQRLQKHRAYSISSGGNFLNKWRVASIPKLTPLFVNDIWEDSIIWVDDLGFSTN
jgi:hypothetical protein